MNMITALQNLYKAVSGEDNHKRNISKLLCDIHYAITGQQSSVKNNYSRIIDSMATNWPGGGGGGGSSDFSTAEVTFVNNTGGYLDEQYFDGVPGINDVEDYYSITGWLYVPSMNSDTSVQVTIPLYKNSYWVVDEYITPSGKVISGTSGNITIDEEHSVHITGDCTIIIS